MSRKPGYGAYLFLALLILLVSILGNLFSFVHRGDGTSSISAYVSGPEIDINSARREELVLVPGIGESLAEEIVLKREELGGFDSPEDLMSVRGIGRAKFDRLKAFIDVSKGAEKR